MEVLFSVLTYLNELMGVIAGMFLLILSWPDSVYEGDGPCWDSRLSKYRLD